MPALLPSKTTAPTATAVNVPTGNPDFRARQRNLIERLAFLEGSLNVRNNDPEAMDVDVEGTDRHRERRNRRSTRALRGQESIFKVPGSPPRRANRMPDFRRNPSRWTRYSLADVSSADMSDTTNTSAAMAFLQSRQTEPEPEREELPARVSFTPSIRRGQQRERKLDDDEPEPVAGPSTPTIVAFGDPCPAVEVASSSTAKPVYKDNKLVMPEYVIGEKKPKPKKSGKKAERGKELSLSHLMEQEDE